MGRVDSIEKLYGEIMSVKSGMSSRNLAKEKAIEDKIEELESIITALKKDLHKLKYPNETQK